MSEQTMKKLITDWRAQAMALDRVHATMGAGWWQCAKELEAALSASGAGVDRMRHVPEAVYQRLVGCLRREAQILSAQMLGEHTYCGRCPHCLFVTEANGLLRELGEDPQQAEPKEPSNP